MKRKKMSKVRVLHILNELSLSGMEMMLLNSYSEWEENDIEITILATGRNFGEAAKKLEAAGYRTIHIPFVDNKKNAFFQLKSFLKINRFDIIHINTEANFLLHVLNAYFSGHKIIVRTFHSVFQPRFLGKTRRIVDRIIAKLFLVKYISVGDSVAKNELKHYFTKSTLIYNWYDAKRFFINSNEVKSKKRQELNISKDKFVVSIIGNCSRVKRHHLVLQALSLLPDKIDWVLLHAGNEEPGFPERKLAVDLNISERCRFLGSVTNVEDILNVSDVYIMSSKVEGLGIAAIEAMACGVPTILTKSPGLTDLIDRIEEIKGVDSNAQEIAKSICELENMTEYEKNQVSVNIANKAYTLFSMKKGVKNYSNYYNHLLQPD